MNQEETIERAQAYNNTSFFDISNSDYQSALSRCVKPTLRIVYDQLMENLSGLDGKIMNPAMIDDLLSTFYFALVMWDQTDKQEVENRFKKETS